MIEGFDQRSDRIACEEIAEEEGHRPHSNNNKHSIRPDLESFDGKNAHIKDHD